MRTPKKAQDAFSKCKKPLIVEDDGIFIDSLGGFPGPYSSYVHKTIGNKGILNLLKYNKLNKVELKRKNVLEEELLNYVRFF